MKDMNNMVKGLGFYYDESSLVKSYKEALKDEDFKNLVDNLNIERKELVKRTTTLEECVKEYKNCKTCPNIFECKNKIEGYCYSPMIVDGMLEFNYVICKYKKEIDKANKYMENIYTYNMPKDIKNAKMSDIYTQSKSRHETIKWIFDFVKNYKKEAKGLYLNGNFGCGKTYLISAAFNELAKKDIKSAIIYWPEFLRDLKSSFDSGYNEKYEYIKNVELLLIDDIGAEEVTGWSRDEILGTILQYRMQEHKTTFFTSNLTIEELENHFSNSKNGSDIVKARRIIERVKQLTYDMEMMSEVGYTNGIENYSRHLEGRKAGQPPHTLLDFFPDDFLILIDESHATMPELKAMYNGDRARKQTLIDYGFRLPSALDNRPLKLEEFEKHVNQIMYVSATPGDYELNQTDHKVEQIIRPTGLLDPEIEVRPIKGQIDDLVGEVNKRIERNERVFVTTLTKKMAEDLTDYLKDLGIKVRYLHSDIKTLERLEIIRDLRLGKFDVLIGINLLREGIDVPEVSLVAILDADKEGFLRSTRPLVQTIGRAARNSNGKVIMYADSITDSMREAIDATERRRCLQMKFNKEHGITPKTIVKPIRDVISITKDSDDKENKESFADLNFDELTKKQKQNMIKTLTAQMQEAAKKLDFEEAANLRDAIMDLKKQVHEKKK